MKHNDECYTNINLYLKSQYFLKIKSEKGIILTIIYNIKNYYNIIDMYNKFCVMYIYT